MTKKLFILTIMLFTAFATNAFAHTGLESSSPADGQVVTENLDEVSLTFESKIEQGSTFELKNTTGDVIAVDNIIVSENQMTGSLSQTLENGSYQVLWKIVGSDGHLIEGQYSFTVEIPVVETPVEEPAKEPVEAPDDEPVTEEDEHKQTQQEKQLEENKAGQSADASDNKLPSFVIPSIIGALVIIIIVSFFWLMRRKK
ncbi:copper resistance CopC family protein [Bacillus canaveralius]|uniref:copper resistance CopC family protein n=1 Tax=Bacillus canaveralius TaxID=1403243 RepID=UPI000F7832E9|nr:copper resistance protein CopC [Bacillus canaveralius]RSK47927.1 hypothetical protein EJA13_17795 [Bacillus canaveralius]